MVDQLSAMATFLGGAEPRRGGLSMGDDYAAYRRTLESGGDPNARATTSSAAGADQFLSGTWLNTVGQARPAWAEGLSRQELLDARFDESKSGEMADYLDNQNADILSRAGVPVNNHTLYAAHHFGPKGGLAFASAGDDTPMTAILSPDAIRANPYLRGKTKGDVVANWDRRAGSASSVRDMFEAGREAATPADPGADLFRAMAGLTPEAPVEAPQAPKSKAGFWNTVGDVGHQLAAGTVVDLPRMTGQIVRRVAPDGTSLDEWGKEVVAAADERAKDWQLVDRERGLLAEAAVKVVRAVPPMLPAIAASYNPLGMITGPLVAGATFGLSAAQDTEDKLIEQGIDPDTAFQAGILTGVVQGPLEAGATATGLKAFKAAAPLFGAGGKGVVDVVKRATDTAVLKPFAKSFGLNMLVQPATEVAQDTGTELIERAYGAKPEDLGQIARDSALVGAGLTMLLGPFALGGNIRRARNAEELKTALEDPTVPEAVRAQARDIIIAQAEREGVKPGEIDAWLDEQLTADDERQYEQDYADVKEANRARRWAETEVEVGEQRLRDANLSWRLDESLGREERQPADPNYAKEMEALLNEPTGEIVQDPNGWERPQTRGEAIGMVAAQEVAPPAPAPVAPQTPAQQVATREAERNQRARTQYKINKAGALATFAELDQMLVDGLIDENQFEAAADLLAGDEVQLAEVRKQLADIKSELQLMQSEQPQPMQVGKSPSQEALDQIAQDLDPQANASLESLVEQQAQDQAEQDSDVAPVEVQQDEPMGVTVSRGVNARLAEEGRKPMGERTQRRLWLAMGLDANGNAPPDGILQPRSLAEVAQMEADILGHKKPVSEQAIFKDINGLGYTQRAGKIATSFATDDQLTSSEGGRVGESGVRGTMQRGEAASPSVEDVLAAMQERAQEEAVADATIDAARLQDRLAKALNNNTAALARVPEARDRWSQTDISDFVPFDSLTPRQQARYVTAIAAEQAEANRKGSTDASRLDAWNRFMAVEQELTQEAEKARRVEMAQAKRAQAEKAPAKRVHAKRVQAEDVAKRQVLDSRNDKWADPDTTVLPENVTSRLLSGLVAKLKALRQAVGNIRTKDEGVFTLKPAAQADLEQRKALAAAISTLTSHPILGPMARRAIGGLKSISVYDPANDAQKAVKGIFSRVRNTLALNTSQLTDSGANPADLASAQVLANTVAHELGHKVDWDAGKAVGMDDYASTSPNSPLYVGVSVGANGRIEFTFGPVAAELFKAYQAGQLPQLAQAFRPIVRLQGIIEDTYGKPESERVPAGGGRVRGTEPGVQDRGAGDGVAGSDGAEGPQGRRGTQPAGQARGGVPGRSPTDGRAAPGVQAGDTRDSRGRRPDLRLKSDEAARTAAYESWPRMIEAVLTDPDAFGAIAPRAHALTMEVLQAKTDADVGALLAGEAIIPHARPRPATNIRPAPGADGRVQPQRDVGGRADSDQGTAVAQGIRGAVRNAGGPRDRQPALHARGRTRDAGVESSGADRAPRPANNTAGLAAETEEVAAQRDMALPPPPANETPKQAQTRANNAVKDVLQHAADAKNWAVLKGGFTLAIANVYKKHLPSLERYVALTRRGQADQMKAVLDIDSIMGRFKALKGDEASTKPGSVNALLKDSTRSRKWAFEPDWLPKGSVKVDPALAAQYNKLSEEAQRVVREVFKHGHDATVLMRQQALNSFAHDQDTLIEQYRKQGNQEALRKAEDKKLRSVETFDWLAELDTSWPYAPLKRFGDFVVIAKSKEFLAQEAIMNDRTASDEARSAARKRVKEMKGQDQHYGIWFDNRYKTRAHAEKLRAMPQFKGGRVENMAREGADYARQGDMLQAFHRLRDMVDNATDSELREKSSAALNRLMSDLHLSLLSEQSARQSGRRRQDVLGADDDMMRAFDSQARAMANFTASLHNTRGIQDALASMRQEVRDDGNAGTTEERMDVFNEILRRHAMSMDVKTGFWHEMVGKVMAGTSAWMLLTSISYHVINTTQPWAMSMPVMAAKHGYGRAQAALLKAYQDVAPLLKDARISQDDFSKLPADVRAAVQQLADEGVIMISLTNEMGSVSSSENPVAAKIAFKLHRVAQVTEAVNRLSTAIAALRLENQRGVAGEKAVEYARQIIDQTHGEYAAWNASRLMNTPFGRMATQFRKIQLIQLSLWTRLVHDSFRGENATVRKEARRAAMFSLAHMGVLGGMVGMPGFHAIAFILDRLLGGDDEPWDTEEELRQGLGDSFMGQLLRRGLPAALGGDISGRAAAGDMLSILPFTDLSPSKEGYQAMATGLMGPFFGGILPRMWEGAGLMRQGQLQKGFEAFMPKGFADLSRAIRQESEGVTNRKGDVLLTPDDLSLMSSFLQGIGISPTQTMERSRQAGVKWRYEEFTKQRAASLQREYQAAVKDGDAEARARIIREWMAFQKNRQEHGFKMQPVSTLLKSAQAQAKRERNTVGGIQYNRNNQRYVERLVGADAEEDDTEVALAEED